MSALVAQLHAKPEASQILGVEAARKVSVAPVAWRDLVAGTGRTPCMVPKRRTAEPESVYGNAADKSMASGGSDWLWQVYRTQSDHCCMRHTLFTTR